MGPADLLLHSMGLLAPAVFLALLLPLSARFLLRRTSPALALWTQIVLQLALGAAVVALGLWWFGRDGKMATYGALVLAMATAQWAVLRAWR
jgi:hypothetical protein